MLPKLECSLNRPNAFFSTHLEVLGHIVTRNGRIPDPNKVQAISDFPMVNSQTAVQKLLGMVGFYRHHIPSFAQRTSHLRELLQKDRKFQLTAQVEAEFNDLIAALTGPDVLLRYPDWSKPFHVLTDASQLGVGAVLMQMTSITCGPFSMQAKCFHPPRKDGTRANRNSMPSNGQLNNGAPIFWVENSLSKPITLI